MLKKISCKKIEELYKKGISIKKISEKIGISYSAVYHHIRFKERGFKDNSEYIKYWLGEKGFENYSEYQDSLAVKKGFKDNSEYIKDWLGKKGFKNYSKYQDSLAVKRGFKNYSEYQDSLAVKRGFKDNSEYIKDWLGKKGFKNCSEYKNSLEKRTANKPESKKLSRLINQRLNELNQPIKWLSMELGINNNSMYKIVQGKKIPKENVLEKLFQKLEVPYKTLDDLLEDNIIVGI